MTVEECPLLVLEQEPPEPDPAAGVRIVAADDPELGLVRAAVNVGFGTSGTSIGEASVAERDADARAHPETAERIAALITAGLGILAGAFDAQVGPVGGGSHNPRADVTEIVGVGVLPAYRRRGLAAAITARLARHAPRQRRADGVLLRPGRRCGPGLRVGRVPARGDRLRRRGRADACPRPARPPSSSAAAARGGWATARTRPRPPWAATTVLDHLLDGLPC